MVQKKFFFALLVLTMACSLTSCGEKYYTIRFLNDDGSLLFEADKVLENATPEYQGNIPLKAKTDHYSYTFKGWDKEIGPATENSEYTAVYESAVNQYDVRFLNYDDSLVDTISVPYDGTAFFCEKTPTKPSTDQYTYTFTDWNGSLEHIKSDCVRKAVYQENVREYTVDYRNYDGTILDTQTIEYGHNARYSKDLPTKPDDGTHTFTFIGWDFSETNITNDMALTAVFKDMLKQFIVIFNNDDGKMLYRTTTDAGSSATYLGSTPTKPSTERLDYVFTDWDKELTNILADTVVTAQYESTPKTLYVSFKNDDGSLLQTEKVKYGETVIYSGSTPSKDKTAQYTYFFAGWDKALSNITVDCERWATFSETINKYTVQFVNYDGSLLQKIEINYGSSAEYSGAKPEKPSDNVYGYVFTGWDKETVSITDDLIVTAQFSKTDYLTYVLSSDKTYYVAYRNNEVTLPETIAIPSSYSGLPVKEIGGSAFKETAIKNVFISDSVVKIGENAFLDCSSLSSVNIPTSVTTIGNIAFHGCSSLETIDIPSSVTSIGNDAFHGCPIKNITLPDHLSFLGDGAFSWCSSLLSITIPSSISILKCYMFQGCTSLSSVILSPNLTTIEEYAFENCLSLPQIIFPSALNMIGYNAFYGCSLLESVSFPFSVSSIGDAAFSDCSALSSVIFAGTISSFYIATGSGISGIFASSKVQFIQCSDGNITL